MLLQGVASDTTVHAFAQGVTCLDWVSFYHARRKALTVMRSDKHSWRCKHPTSCTVPGAHDNVDIILLQAAA